MKKLSSNTLILLLVFLSSCQWFKGGKDEEVLAKVGDQVLYLDAVIADVDFSKTIDSTHLIENYIENWVKDQLLVKKAKQNLSEEEINFDQQLESYRNSLIIYAYENQLVTQKLDTQIADTVVENYYNQNASNFELRGPLVQGRYLQLIHNAPKQDSIYKWLSGNLIDDEENLAKYCTLFATDCQLDSGRWSSVETLSGTFPNKSASDILESLSLGHNVISDSNTILIIDVKAIIYAGKTAPLPYVTTQIKSIIRNRKRLKLIANAKKDIYEEATLKKKYEVYY